MKSSEEKVATSIPLCVDLDGTLLKTDLLHESLVHLLKKDVVSFLMLLTFLLRGKAAFKAELANRVDIDDMTFPVNEQLLSFIAIEHGTRTTVLVTGSHQVFADSIAKKYPLFDLVIGSGQSVNLTGNDKRERLESLFGKYGYDYIGNDEVDRAVWKSANLAGYAGSEKKKKNYGDIDFALDFSHSVNQWSSTLKMMRIHQWTKNFLLLVPLFLDQQFNSNTAIVASLIGFLAFSFLASATYILNDMLDLQSDRMNATKKHRSLASGLVSLRTGIVSCSVLGISSLILCLVLPAEFLVLLASYLILTLLYSFKLKSMEFLDVCSIAVLHTMRIVAGTIVIGAEHSFWLLTFSIFIFTSFALAKRVTELVNLKSENRSKAIGRGYSTNDIPLLTSAGMSSGYVSVLVVALFVNSDKVKQNYDSPEVLWLLCPGIIYLVGRIWLMVTRGKVHEDPIVYVLTDKVSLLTVLSLMVIVSIGFLL